MPIHVGPTRRAEIRAGTQPYGRMEIRLDGWLRTFLRWRPLPMGLSVRTLGVVTYGAPPIQGWVTSDGTMGPISTLGSLRALRNDRYRGRHVAGVYWEHDFRTILWEALRLQPLVARRTGVSIGGAHAFIRSGTGRVHHELTVSLTGVLGSSFRVDLTRRLGAEGWFVSAGLSRTL